MLLRVKKKIKAMNKAGNVELYQPGDIFETYDQYGKAYITTSAEYFEKYEAGSEDATDKEGEKVKAKAGKAKAVKEEAKPAGDDKEGDENGDDDSKEDNDEGEQENNA